MKYTRLSLQDFLGDLSSQINPSQKQIDEFKSHISKLQQTNTEETEEHQKNAINSFLTQSFKYDINTKGRIDAAIYEDNEAKVIIEAKSLKNKSEFPAGEDTLESKAFCESILYYLRESITNNNNAIRHIILCNLNSFYIIDAKEYHHCFAKDKAILKSFKNTELKEGNDTRTEKFYEDIAYHLKTLDAQIPYVYFNLADTTDEDIPLIYAILSPTTLLKQKMFIDSNTLNQGFYDELLYILGLCEKLESGKVIIIPSTTSNTLLDSITKNLGFDREKDFEEIFSLLTTWNNRILFLRLLESMLLSFNHIKKPFLDLEIIPDFKIFNQLFFDVLAIKETNRSDIPKGLEEIPYLNSSLFEKTLLEKETNGGKNKQIRSLDSKPLELHKSSILKKDSQYKNKDSLPLLEYLFAFLHSYDFTTTPKDIENHTKINFDKLINSAVLGLVFEKLNGYKEGSFYTPSFITSYMCRESITKLVIDKFNAAKNWSCKTLDELYNKIDDLQEASKIFHSITICDPAVGSGHFLVSSLNELIYIKYKLGILCDEENRRLRDIDLKLKNDEVIIKDSSGEIHNYTIPSHEKIESHVIQKAMFYTKKDIIENCLFGVDINPNSCEITKLRLWIELLKYSYYEDIEHRYLQTLPNIDINIKTGNSLLSNFPINSKLTIGLTNQFTQNLKTAIEDYKTQVNLYKEALKDKQVITNKISDIKTMLKNHFIKWDKRTQSLEESVRKFVGKYGENIFKWEMRFGDSNFGLGIQKIIDDSLYDEQGKPASNPIKFQTILFGDSSDLKPKENPDDLDKQAQKLLDSIKSDFEYLESLKNSNSFEWRFEFPEVLDENGDFIGFDLVIGNPPYIRQERIKEIKPHLSIHFEIFSGTSDIFTYFFEQGYKVLKEKGRLSFITSNKWTRAGYGKALRSFILGKTKLETYVEFNGVKVFDSATVDTSILEFQKTKSSKADFRYIPITTKPEDGTDISNVTPQIISTDTLSSEAFTFGDSEVMALKKKIESIGVPLKDWDINIYRGILTGYNEAFIIDTDKKDEILDNCDNTDASKLPFKLIEETYIRAKEDEEYIIYLNERERTEQIIRPILRGRDIKRYSYEWAGKWVIGTFPTLKLNIDEYLSLKNYLESFMPKIAQSGEKGCRKKTSNKWFETQDNIAYWNEFNRQKIVWAEMTKDPCFVYSNDGIFINQTCYFIPNASKYHLAILNSKLTYFYIQFMASSLGEGAFRWIKQYIEKIPVPKVNEKNQSIIDKITLMTDEILALKEQSIDSDISLLDQQINQLVYELYELSDDEIAFVERS
ncbi:hypothetical protein BKH42_03890 [Helicobacter sp. 13S00482-2]|uniref:DUF7149 domain-containing protein n=1 Tax=Helicobacter sp. 13S00482-2 TaxID=1476200 RepID=UPI000BA745AF|nr:Eco57I restriction-modification methylase domain-containing protein [Helicobacter sp. 13S00482-2]PAF53884.1 hypothetical protein BKH42_03890 [Helicobacter sp. 13S00482-2]